MQLWRPRERAKLLVGLRVDGVGVCRSPQGIVDGLASHWGQIFSHRCGQEGRLDAMLAAHGMQGDLAKVPPPTLRHMKAFLRNMGYSSPGPDALPYAAWRVPGGPEHLY